MNIIYKPAGKAQEYSLWAANFYLGCSNNCSYCYNNQGIIKKLYEAALDKFGENVVKLKVVPLTFIDISKNLQAKRGMDEVTEILVELIQQIQDDSVAAIQGYKRDDKGSKDVKIEKKLNELWKAFEPKIENFA